MDTTSPAAARSTGADPVDALFGFDPAAVAWPYDAYAQMRDRGVWFSDTLGAWIVSRFGDARAVLRTPKTFSSAAPMGPGPAAAAEGIRVALLGSDPVRGARVGQFLDERGRLLFMADGDVHRGDRARLATCFTATRMDALREPVRQICAELIDGFPDDRPVDLVTEYAALVAARSLGRVLGAADERRDDFAGWATAINAALGPIEHDHLPVVAERIDDYLLYFNAQIQARHADPGEDLLSAIVTGQDETTGHRFRAPQILGLLGQFVAAGVATTASAIASTIRVLATHPDLDRQVREDHAALEPLINEVLRLESPVQALYRTAVAEARIGEATIAAGDQVMVFFAGANRDPNVFPDPDRLDLGRGNLGAHLAFGYGPHYCIGAPLGTREIAVAVRTLLDRTTAITLTDDPPDYMPLLILRGLTTLPAALS